MSRAQEISDLLSGVTITTADNLPQLTLKSTDADGGRGPDLVLTRDSASPADGDAIGFISWTADNDAGADHAFCGIEVLASDVSDGSEDATWQLFTQVAGTSRSRFSATPTETVLNEDSVDLDFRVESNGNANMLVVDAGNDKVGIGTNSPANKLSVVGGDFGTLLLDNADASHGTQILFQHNGTVNTGCDIQMSDAGGMKIRTLAVEDITFHTSSSAGSPVERMKILSGGNVDISAGHILLDNGYGIDFSATGNSSGTTTSELLDDYEEGTWTPSYVDGTSSATYSTQSGRYTKIGNTVFFEFQLDGNSITGDGDHLKIGGLPYTANSANLGGAYIVYSGGVPNDIPVNGTVFGSQTRIGIYKYSNGGTVLGNTMNLNGGWTWAGHYDV
tara:strand:- start:916 stop:2085 length:1170 start_codon:yes stop_codon:yes gene_type:complete